MQFLQLLFHLHAYDTDKIQKSAEEDRPCFKTKDCCGAFEALLRLEIKCFWNSNIQLDDLIRNTRQVGATKYLLWDMKV